ncbi:hypothetical protein Q0M94_20420 (plasmid) [Deinococcus radiomollis]|uniref:hypothetical protein n=1 Tax=Deinococcus radiomollis TaxID=468916 RepID=UPI003892BAAB
MRLHVPALLAISLALASCGQSVNPPVSSASAPIAPTPVVEVDAAADSLDSLSLSPASLSPSSYGQPVSVRNGTLHAGASALFPFGFYHVSWMSDSATRKRDMLELSAAGFNTMTASVINDDDDAHYGEFLDEAAHARMYVMTEGVFPTTLPKLVNKPAVLGWMVADDCNLQYSAAQVKARGDAVRALDPSHPTYAALFTSYSNAQSDFFGTTDMMGNMSYPIGPGDSIGSTYDMERLSVINSERSGTVPIANLQAFSWGTVPGHDTSARMPTPAEVYNMTYQAVGAGVKGVLYYTYLDSYNSVRRSPGVWEMVKSIVPELAKVSPMLLGAKPQFLDTNNGLIHATAWVYQGHTYLLLTNVSATSAQPVYLPLNTYKPSKLKPLFSGRAGAGVKLSGQTLGGTIAPLAAHFYQIN